MVFSFSSRDCHCFDKAVEAGDFIPVCLININQKIILALNCLVLWNVSSRNRSFPLKQNDSNFLSHLTVNGERSKDFVHFFGVNLLCDVCA